MVDTPAARAAARARAARLRAMRLAETVRQEPHPSRGFALSVLLTLAVLALIRLPGLRWIRAAATTENLVLNRPRPPHRWLMTKLRSAAEYARNNSEEAGLAGLVAAGSALAALDWKADRDEAARRNTPRG